ncbi:MAG: metalloregulator ArsR/SmtB family transcription factor [Hyphomicrobiales bacterium]|nr:metalloregulator ArsR/SmtB family transcription factor [Hyphomicrobiales bacterium]
MEKKKSHKSIQDISCALSALGHENRLAIFQLLVRAGEDGLNVGEIIAHLNIPASTLAHHLGALANAQLVTQERNGREIINRANFTLMREIVSYLTAECCVGVKPKGKAA